MEKVAEGLKIVGVSRGNEFSPNHVGNDAAIFQKVVDELVKMGCHVETFTETNFVEKQVKADVVFDMARNHATLEYLKYLENEGTVVINSAQGIGNCVRKTMTELLIENHSPHPKSVIIPTNCSYELDFFPCWIKRGNSHAIVKEDVVYVECKEEAEHVLSDFRKRGIPEAVVNEHLVGDLVKFYGVADTDFFYFFSPTEQSHSKFGLEAINGETRGFPFDGDLLCKYSTQAASCLNVPIYGGDCVISSSGEIRIIDFNDWPSFARCKDIAGVKIAEYIYRKIIQKAKGNGN